jgi:hypothetical protein
MTIKLGRRGLRLVLGAGAAGAGTFSLGDKQELPTVSTNRGRSARDLTGGTSRRKPPSLGQS